MTSNRQRPGPQERRHVNAKIADLEERLKRLEQLARSVSRDAARQQDTQRRATS